jgi:hypothetical protein
MSSKKKYQERLEQLERFRQAKVARTHQKGEKIRKKSSTYRGKEINLELSEKQIEYWTTKKTNISPTQGSKEDYKAGRTKGRYLKGKL